MQKASPISIQIFKKVQRVTTMFTCFDQLKLQVLLKVDLTLFKDKFYISFHLEEKQVSLKDIYW